MREGMIDLLDMSLWDVSREPLEEEFRGRSLLSYFTDLDRGRVRLGAAGKIMSGADAAHCLDAGADVVVVGRGAILHHDFPIRVQKDPAFEVVSLPVTEHYLRSEGLGAAFIKYMHSWKGFVQAETT